MVDERKISLQKSTVIHVISGDLWAGAEVQVYHTLCNLNKYCNMVLYVILFNDGVLNKKLREKGIATFVIDEKNNSFISIILELLKLFKSLTPEIIHVHAYKEHLLVYIAKWFQFKKIGVIRTFHGMSEAPKSITLIKKIKAIIIHKIEKMILNNKLLYIVAVSKDLEKYLRVSYSKSSIVQIYNAIVKPDAVFVNKKSIREKYGVDIGTCWIGTLARLAEPKNLGLLVDVARLLEPTGLNFKISIFGEGSLRKQIQNKIDNAGVNNFVKLEGFCDDAFPTLTSFDIFALCSFHEGLPMSLLEAMAAGVPVVCTNVGGIGEVIENNESGILVESNDAEAFAAAIISLFQNKELQKKLVQKAEVTIESRFAVENTNIQLLNVYNKMLTNG